MGALSQIINWLRAPSDQNILDWASGFFDDAPGSVNEPIVNTTTAMRVAAIHACVKVIAETLASLSVTIERLDKSKNWQEDKDHFMYSLLHDAPSERYTSFSWIEATSANAALSGNGLGRVIYSKNGRPGEIIHLGVDTVTQFVDKNTGKLYYDIQGGSERYPSKEIIHLKGFSLNGLIGLSPISHLKNIISMGMSTVEYAKENYQNGAYGGGVVTHPLNLKSAARENISKGIMRSLASRKFPILDEGMQFHPLKLSPKDLDFVNTMQWGGQQIASVYRVPAHLIGDLSRSTNNNIEQQSLEFVMYCIRPWVKRWEHELNNTLISSEDRRKVRIRFKIDSLLRGDVKTRHEAYKTGITNGYLTRNEARRMEGMPSIEGLDDPLIPLNMIDLQQFIINSKKDPDAK